MKVIIQEKYGSPDVLKVGELKKPIPGEDQVLIRVYASTVNRTDCANLRAKPFIMRFVTGFLKPRNLVPGTDFAGIIESKGNQVNTFSTGDKVFGFDDSGLGSKAEYLVLDCDKAILKMPENISYERAAASLEGSHYAYNFINKVDLKGGDSVLVIGASGAIGSALVQMLIYHGSVISAVCDAKNIELIRSLGAKQIFDYKTEDFTRSESTYDYIFDAVGKSSFKKCKPLLKTGGVYISSEMGAWMQNLFYAVLTLLFGKKKVIFPIPFDIKRSISFVSEMMDEGKFMAVIDRKYSLDEVVDAYRYVETGMKTGNVIITMNT